jgi:hypothetical protein
VPGEEIEALTSRGVVADAEAEGADAPITLVAVTVNV